MGTHACAYSSHIHINTSNVLKIFKIPAYSQTSDIHVSGPSVFIAVSRRV